MSVYIPSNILTENMASRETLNLSPSLTYKLTNTSCGGSIDNLESVKQFVYTQLSIDKYKYKIYDNLIGNELYTLIGASVPYAKVEIPRIIKEALLWDRRIRDVNNFNITQLRIDALLVSFTVETIYGKYATDTTVAL